MKGLHTGFIVASLVIHAFIVFKKRERVSVRIPIRMAPNEGRVRLEMTKPKKKPPVKKVKKKNVRKIAKKKVVEEPPPPLEEVPIDRPIQQDFDKSVLFQKAIVYPALAVRRGWEGAVYLKIFIDGMGQVEKVETKRPHTYKVLAEAAIAGVRAWRFHPRPDSRGYSVLKKINFKLKNI